MSFMWHRQNVNGRNKKSHGTKRGVTLYIKSICQHLSIFLLSSPYVKWPGDAVPKRVTLFLYAILHFHSPYKPHSWSCWSPSKAGCSFWRKSCLTKETGVRVKCLNTWNTRALPPMPQVPNLESQCCVVVGTLSRVSGDVGSKEIPVLSWWSFIDYLDYSLCLIYLTWWLWRETMYITLWGGKVRC